MIPFLLNEGLNPKKLYENFHTEEFAVAHNDPDFKCNSISKISIDSNLILEANLSNLKEILDIHLKVFPLHPLNKNFFQSLATKIKDKKPILLENKEAYFHKKENGNLIIIPKNSSLLKRPKIILKAGKSFILWNEKELELEEGFTLGVYQNGLKILQNKMHKSVSEIFRETNIPVLVRKNIPILFQDAIPIKILFEMYEPSIRSCIGDLK
ncbi:MAG: tRNA lysidine(34) synthetase TilS [Leptospiraceae bacterium]|nr:tRNA lysidine(34) synthetase TilS [Leptospiraceae bacterium]